MTDRELLVLAAKAAGIRVPTKKDYPYEYIDERGIHRDISWGGDGSHMSHWNPLVDDGDALRLAVKLGLLCGFVQPNCWAELPGQYPSYEPYEPDPYAATRRAIVRAAAEIGRSNT